MGEGIGGRPSIRDRESGISDIFCININPPDRAHIFHYDDKQFIVSNVISMGINETNGYRYLETDDNRIFIVAPAWVSVEIRKYNYENLQK